jgi:hypothetical protein
MTFSLLGDDVGSLHEERNLVGTNYISYIDYNNTTIVSG